MSPWSDPQVTTRSLPILEGGTEYSTQSNYSNTQDFGHGWVLRDGDELIQLQTAKITEGMAKVCEEMPCGVSFLHF